MSKSKAKNKSKSKSRAENGTPPRRTRADRRKAKSKAPVYSQILECREQLINGRVVAIDPSIGSGSSMPGYTIFEAGQLIETGILDVTNVNRSAVHRLKEIGEMLRNEFDTYDVLVIEDVPVIRAGAGMNPYAVMGAAKSVASLMKSVGAIVASTRWTHIVEISPRTWQSRVDANWTKSDHKDSEYIGRAAIEIARELSEG